MRARGDAWTAPARWSEQRAERGADGSQTTFSSIDLAAARVERQLAGDALVAALLETLRRPAHAPLAGLANAFPDRELLVAKNRHGMSGTVPLNWTPTAGAFIEVDRDDR